MLHGVDRDRNGAHRPRIRLRPQQRQRNREGVIDQHLLAHRHVELVGDELLDQVPGQRGIARVRARDRQAPSLIRMLVLGRSADREGRHLVEEEVEAVIVVENDHDIRLLLRQPLMGGAKPVEERLPIRIALQPFGDRIADRGDVRGADPADDGRHG